MLHAVIMAGGSGTRFWPRSRRGLPKQLLRLVGNDTLIRQTHGRLDGLVPHDRTWVVTNRDLAEETAAQLPDLPAGRILREPLARNTAPCIGLAAIELLAVDPDAVMLVLPADHVIDSDERFRQAAQAGARLVEQDPERLVLFGVPPTGPATGFGYIERGPALDDHDAAFAVASFREKPDEATAREYVADGGFYWNCGIFVWRAAAILAALAEFEPEIDAALSRLSEVIGGEGYEKALASEYESLKSISIDYAVLERADGVFVVEAPFGWDDVGSWTALGRLLGHDDDGNTTQGLVAGIDSGGLVVHTSDEHLVATAGVEDLVIVHTPDATLVARRDDEAGLRRLIEMLGEQGLERFL